MEQSISLSNNDAIVDVQGFFLPSSGFVLKEIAILTHDNLFHWIFRPPQNLPKLTDTDKYQILWASKYHHQFPWYSGFEKYEEAEKLIESALENIEKIYVKGLQKCNWISFFLKKKIEIINVEDLDCNIRLKDDMPYKFCCTFHSGVCAVYNAHKISAWFEKHQHVK